MVDSTVLDIIELYESGQVDLDYVIEMFNNVPNLFYLMVPQPLLGILLKKCSSLNYKALSLNENITEDFILNNLDRLDIQCLLISKKLTFNTLIQIVSVESRYDNIIDIVVSTQKLNPEEIKKLEYFKELVK